MELIMIGFSENQGDCDDNNAAITKALENCDGIPIIVMEVLMKMQGDGV